MSTRLCQICGFEREVGPEIGSRGRAHCYGCGAEQRAAEARKSWWRHHPVPDESLVCERCGRLWVRGPKQRSHFCDTCRPERKDAYQRVYRAEHPDAMRSYCAAYRERVYSDPYLLEVFREKNRENARRLRAADPERYREIERRTYAKRRADPVRWRKWLDEQQERTRARRLERGEPVRVLTPRVYNLRFGTERLIRVDATPIVRLIEEWFAIDDGRDRAGLQQAAHVSPRTFDRILNGKQTHLSVGTADRLCSALNVPLANVYPLAS